MAGTGAKTKAFEGPCPVSYCQTDVAIDSKTDEQTGTPAGGIALTHDVVSGPISAEGVTSAPGDPTHGVSLHNDTVVTHSAEPVVTSTATPVTVAHSLLAGYGGIVIQNTAAPSSITGTVVEQTVYTGVFLYQSVATLDHDTFYADGGDRAGPAVYIDNASSATLDCLRVSGNAGGIRVPAPSGNVEPRITNSVLSNNTSGPNYDLDNPGHVTASGVWWGHPGGPTSGQVSHPSLLHNFAPPPGPPACAGAHLFP
jgi:hypothetical protein